MIYLDNAATTRMHPEVLKAMIPYMTDEYGNAGTLYSFGRRSGNAIDNARSQVADLIGAPKDNIIFTSGGTEANNMAFKCVVSAIQARKKSKILTSCVEHHSVLRSSWQLDNIFSVDRVGVLESGKLDMEDLTRKWNDDVGIVSVMFENNELGCVNDVDVIGRYAKERGALFHTDCVQAAGWHEIDVDKIGCDFLSLSSHKIHGPKGVGALYVRDITLLEPLIIGGAMQERGCRGGTENVAGIVGFGKACEMAIDNYPKTKEACRLGHDFVNTLRKHWGDSGWRVHSEVGESKIVSVGIDGVDAETLMMFLDAVGICVSAGSACRSREVEPSHVLKAIGLSDEEAMNTIRVSFSIMNTSDEVIQAAEKLVESVEMIRDMKGAWCY